MNDINPGSNTTQDAPPPATPGKIRITLEKPIRAHDDDNVTVLEMREPTAMDIESIGMPVKWEVRLEGAETVILTPMINPRVMSQMILTLAAIPLSSVRMMHPRDWSTAAMLLANFFVPHPGTV